MYAEIKRIYHGTIVFESVQMIIIGTSTAVTAAVFIVSKSETEGGGNLLDSIILLYENAATSLDDGCTV